MRSQNFLFSQDSLDDQLRARQQGVSAAVDEILKEQFLISSHDELVEHVVAKFQVEPIVLHEEAQTMRQEEAKVDVSRDPRRLFHPEHSGPFYVPGTKIEIEIPFTGEAWIFRYRTNPFSSLLPQAEIDRDKLRISIARPHDADPADFKGSYERQMRLMRDYVGYARKQIETFNNSLPNWVQQAVTHRRERLSKHENIAALLDIPLATRKGAPSIEPVKVEIRRPPALPKPPKTGVQPEPGITDETYEHILHYIRHQGRTYERTPATYAIHGEEELRNIILAQLNGHFEGKATGEAFRRRGKTDICIEVDNRAAFVGECKIWTGSTSLTAALDQLLGYLTWRDGKAAIILFNTKNKDFTKLRDAVEATLREHLLFVRDLPCQEAGEWRVQMRSQEDEGRRVTVHVFTFNLN